MKKPGNLRRPPLATGGGGGRCFFSGAKLKNQESVYA